ncbi:WD40 repeat domain-containing protein [Nocardia pseudovaccinii]|uniref:WD40 repeat domain-containing protein n=1 Tax=Nocardia pseudovaccinii TaxID=189540 RepID=UPI0007A4D926|nr:WD40 repeat domain-containing protein [Nocardia pseudovaccinii]
MVGGWAGGLDPAEIRTREEFAAALSALRVAAELTVRQTVELSGCPQGTLSGWFAGQHVPTDGNEKMFRAVLAVCGIGTRAEQEPWLTAVRRVRGTTGRRRRDDESPYRGLEPFRFDDAGWFFGRAELTAELVGKVDVLLRARGRPRILFVIGASGSGKSSLLSAGLLPALQEEGLTAGVALPGTHPLDALRELEETEVVVLDQFEETWTQCEDEVQRAAFLEAIADHQSTRTVFVLGLRADFYRHAAEESVLHDALAANTVLVRPLSSDGVREVIVEPARKAGWTVDEDLVQLLLLELAPHGSRAAHDAGALPLLSHALLQTWQRGTRRRMTVFDYNAVGRIGGAIQRSADAVYSDLTTAQRQIARRTFLRLVTIDEESVTRRRVHRSELFFDDDTAADVNAVIDRFCAQRLLTCEEETVEITHEAIIGAWNRLSDWVDSDRGGLIVHRRLTHAAQVWHDSGCDPGELLGPARLPLVQEWASTGGHHRDLNQRERDYLAASSAKQQAAILAQRRRTRILQRLVAALAMASVVALVLALAAYTQQQSAAQARDDAMSRQIALQAVRLRDKDPALSAQLALAAYRVEPTLEARSALLDSSAVHTPVRFVGEHAGRTVVATDSRGTLLALGAVDATVGLYQVSGGTTPASEVGRIPAPAGPPGPQPMVLEIGPGDDVLVRITAGRIELWNVVDPRAPHLLSTVHSPGVTHTGVAFSPDRRQLVAGTTDTGLARWDIADPAHPVALPMLVLPAGSPVVAFSLDGTMLAAAGPEASVRIWRLSGTNAEQVFDHARDGSTAQALALRFSPDSKTLVAGGRSREVLRWRLDDPGAPTELPRLRGFDSYINDLIFSPDGSRLAAGSSDHSTRIWNTTTESTEPELILPNLAIVVSVRYALGGRMIITGDETGVAHLWPLPGPVLRGAQSTIYQTPIERTGTRFLTGTGAGDSRPRIWDITDPATPIDYPALGVADDEKTCGAVAFSADGTRAAIGTRTGHIYLWEVHDPRQPHRLGQPIEAVEGIVAAIAFSPDGSVLAVVGQDNPIATIWNLTDPNTPQPIAALDLKEALPNLVAIDSTGTLLAIATTDDVVRVWDIRERGRPPRELPSLKGFDNDVASVAFSPQGRTIVAGSTDHTARLYDLSDPEDPRDLGTLDGPPDPIITVNFSPDGRYVVGGGEGSDIWIWDVMDPDRPRRVAVLTAYTGRVNDAGYALGGQLLIGAGPDKVVRLWATDPDRVADALCDSGSTGLSAAEWQRYLPGVPSRPLCSTR